MIFGKKIKELREEHGMVQRKLAAALDIDTPMYSKIERGERKAKRSHIPIMAKLLEIDEKELLTIFMSQWTENAVIINDGMPQGENK
jgi:transcriptional regulator with XRE-family HTH domain